MDEIHKSALKRTRVALVEDLDVDHIYDHLLSEEIFTSLMLEYIKGERNRIDKTRRLLDDLPRRGPLAYKKFLICLRKCEYGFLADKIEHNENQIRKDKGLVSTHVEQPKSEENSAMHISSSFQSLSNVVSAGGDMNFPSSATSSVSQPTSSRSPSESSSLEMASLSTSEPSSSSQSNGKEIHSYRMNSNPRGLALIINNKKFKDMQERLGTEKDGDRLKVMFHTMGCGVKMINDATLTEMKRHLREFATHEDLDKVDCLFVVLLSHGKENGGVCGTDGHDISGQEIMEIFSAQNCPAMINKPKMFIINACRGERDGSSIPIGSQGASGNVHTDHVEREVNPVGRTASTAPTLPLPQRVVNHQDMIAAYSTFPGHVAYRNTADGSWFIQDLVKVFTEHWHEEHILDLLTQVNQAVSKREDEDFAQIPFPSSSLTKKWYLNPPL
ncbi:hypothetical protein FSP39_004519 [Pinctada imbricata]|uniref:Caspase-2 n=1 Tax=Pinctada imbricata TaxID=66713 RepID=A0AA88YGP0_PINIB|nr:hypothetical protein FSP39_004519 [Pinctada imbricata]